jgi:fructose-1,6-bisphosphatase II
MNKPPRNLGFSLMRATEAAALVASRWVGRGEIIEADQAASKAMRFMLDQLSISGKIVIGEHPQHVSPDLLGHSAIVGDGNGPALDIVVDSIEGVRLLAEGLPDAVSVVAVAPQGTMQTPLPVPHLEKLVVGPKAASSLSPQWFDAPVAWTLGVLSGILQKDVEDLTVFVLNRKRHEYLIEDIRATGARVILRSEGDVVGAVLAAMPGTGIDIMMGTGGTPEGVVAACAVKALEGAILTRFAPSNDAEIEIIRQAGLSEDLILSGDDLVASNEIFFAATGITDGMLMRGVHYHNAGATTHSMVINGRSRIKRQIHAEHHRDYINKLLNGDII